MLNWLPLAALTNDVKRAGRWSLLIACGVCALLTAAFLWQNLARDFRIFS